LRILSPKHFTPLFSQIAGILEYPWSTDTCPLMDGFDSLQTLELWEGGSFLHPMHKICRMCKIQRTSRVKTPATFPYMMVFKNHA
jgi:hypothetical protein